MPVPLLHLLHRRRAHRRPDATPLQPRDHALDRRGGGPAIAARDSDVAVHCRCRSRRRSGVLASALTHAALQAGFEFRRVGAGLAFTHGLGSAPGLLRGRRRSQGVARSARQTPAKGYRRRGRGSWGLPVEGEGGEGRRGDEVAARMFGGGAADGAAGVGVDVAVDALLQPRLDAVSAESMPAV